MASNTESDTQKRPLEFRHEQIDGAPPSSKLGFCQTADLTGNDRPDIIVGGIGGSYPGREFVWKADQFGLPTFRGLRSLFGFDETTVFWYENPGWECHEVASVPFLDVGATLCDVTGDGRVNLVAGQGIRNSDVYWFEIPEDPRERWTPHLLTNRFEKYHDLEAGDVDGDGRAELVGLSQEAEVVFYYDVPEDPMQEPWPDSYLHVVDTGVDIEGCRIVDTDDDGQNEIVAGPYIYHRDDEARTGWRRETVLSDWDRTRVERGDLDGDGDVEMVYSEGDSPHLGTRMGRVAWADGPDWDLTVLEPELFCPHSLQVGDFDGDGLPDIYVAEMGLGKNDDPVHLLFRNRGDGTFDREVIARGIETHEAVAVDLNGDGRLDIVGKSYSPDHHVDIWHNEG